MTNEELAEAIQQGETEKLSELWGNIDRLVCWKANRLLSALGDNANIEFTELYDMGYIALVKAVRTYKPESGPFAGWFIFYLKSAFAEVTGYRTAKQKNDLMRNAVSLNAPLQEDADNPLVDTLPSETDIENEVISSLWQRDLRNELDDILDQIGGIQAEVIRQRYFQNKPYEKIAAALGVPTDTARQEGAAAMLRLRNPAILKRLRPFYEGTSSGKAAAFQHNSTAGSLPQRIGQLTARRNSLLSNKNTDADLPVEAAERLCTGF